MYREQRYDVSSVVWQPVDMSAVDSRGFLIRGETGAGMVIDFGCELYAELCLRVAEINGAANVPMQISFGESVGELVAGAYHKILVQIGSGQTWRSELCGFRFVRIEILMDETKVRLDELYATARRRDFDRIGTLETDDDRINQIWEVGVETVHLCMQDQLWDGIKRGRTVWAGDIYPASLVSSVAFGEVEIITESLSLVRDRSIDPDNVDPVWMNGISGYSLWWLLTQDQWYLYHGNFEYLESQRPYLQRLLPKLFSSVSEEGVEQLSGWRFLDWATSDETSIHAAYQSLFRLAMKASARMCNILGEFRLKQECQAVEKQLSRHTPAVESNLQANALMVLSGYKNAQETNATVLSQTPLARLTPFLAPEVLKARSMADDVPGCLEVVRDYWGAMLDAGATTYWEDFDMAWGPKLSRIDEVSGDPEAFPSGFGRCSPGVAMSLCHAWSAGVTGWLTNTVLGVVPLQPGSRIISITPNLGELNYCYGRFPTKYGPVTIRHERNKDGRVVSEFDLPPEVQIETPMNR